MSINARHEAFYCDYGTSVVAVRCGSDHEVVEQFDLNNSGKFLAENMCKLLNREAAALKRVEAVKLRRLVGVAKDALNRAWMYADKLPHQWPLPVRVKAKMKAALDQIEKEENV